MWFNYVWDDKLNIVLHLSLLEHFSEPLISCYILKTPKRYVLPAVFPNLVDSRSFFLPTFPMNLPFLSLAPTQGSS